MIATDHNAAAECALTQHQAQRTVNTSRSLAKVRAELTGKTYQWKC